nr:MAG TPA: hypothetical protein [Caudoviricetes sp.]
MDSLGLCSIFSFFLFRGSKLKERGILLLTNEY